MKKNQPVKFHKPASTMRRVFQSITDGNHSRIKIAVDTGLRDGQIKSALYNLSFIGLIDVRKENGKSRYMLADKDESPACSACFRFVNSIFNVA